MFRQELRFFMSSVAGSRADPQFCGGCGLQYDLASDFVRSGIDPGLFEAADIDGATGWKNSAYITLLLFETNYVVHIGYLRNRWSSDGRYPGIV